jgi:predicted  nucleic acid-binding Zn-ribbon protein
MAVKTIEEKLEQLFELQSFDSNLDRLRALRGELPMEVSDLEDNITGLETRLNRFNEEVSSLEDQITQLRLRIKDSEKLILKYNEQLNKVKNNREFEALNKEIEIQGLEIQAAQKKIGEVETNITLKKELLSETETELNGRRVDLENKQKELEEITAETEKEEADILVKRDKMASNIEDKLVKAYTRIRENVRNGIAVAPVVRGACGGCFAKIPPQVQSDIRQRKKIVICEHCGRINIDAKMAGIEESLEEEKPKRSRRRKADA